MTDPDLLRIGTRASVLARWQADRVREALDRAGRAMEATVLRALALDRAGDAAAAGALLDGALLLAEQEGYLRTLLDEGEPVLELLARAAKRRSQRRMRHRPTG